MNALRQDQAFAEPPKIISTLVGHSPRELLVYCFHPIKMSKNKRPQPPNSFPGSISQTLRYESHMIEVYSMGEMRIEAKRRLGLEFDDKK